MNQKTERTEKMTVRVTKEQKEQLKKLISKRELTESEAIREGIDMLLNIQIYKDNLDEIIKTVARMIDAKLEPFIKSQRLLNAKYTMSASINTYLVVDMLERLLSEGFKEEYDDAVKTAREKASLYVNKEVPEGMQKEDILDYYEIGDIYRNN